ncbi:MAG: DUF2092 domain-containing protein [Acetobacteraceae bacterium]
MRTRWIVALPCAMSLLWGSIAAAQNSAAAGARQTPPSTTAPAVAEQADRLLKQMAAYVGSAQEFTFHADITFDHVLPSGQNLEYAAAEDVALRRPDELYVEWSGDLSDRQFWYDGKSVTLYDPATPFYGSEPASADIDAMLDKVVTELGFSPPLADFLYRDPYHAVRGNVQFGVYLGATTVNGRRCDSLAFVERDIDWQIWIDTGPQLTPCKLVITYKTQPSQPRFSAVFTDWNFAPRIATPVFTPRLPPDARKIPFAPVVASANPQ